MSELTQAGPYLMAGPHNYCSCTSSFSIRVV